MNVHNHGFAHHTAEEIDLHTHIPPKTFSDKVAFGFVKFPAVFR